MEVFPSRRRFSRDSSSRTAVSPRLDGLDHAVDFRALISTYRGERYSNEVEMRPDITNKLFKTTSFAES